MSPALAAREFHVSPDGNDRSDGSAGARLQTISAAAARAQPGDTVIVHAGVYRERVTPPRGGESDTRRITYTAAPGEKVVIKGSEQIRGWERFRGDVWKVTLPNAFFGAYHPYKDLINGDWFTDRGRPHHTGEVYLNGKSLYETHLLERVLNPQPFALSREPAASTWTWFGESDDKETYLYANFHGRNPNEELVEINVRDSCFYPAKPGCDYITVRGFRLCHAATQWAAPTAEQIGLIGTHWSRGWVIEDNEISDSKCSGLTLGKDRQTGHNVWNADRSKDGATHYNEVIVRALAAGWSRGRIGSHVVRRNLIHDCEQTGICGSLGAVYSTITDNHIYNIWTKRQFAGAEIAGIKLHAAIDVVIERNRIHNAHRGLWMDWMAQGTRITRNLCYNNTAEDLFMEVDHGPYVVDNNVLLSELNLSDMSEGGAFVHNLFAGKFLSRPELGRTTPYHHAHDTALAGLSRTKGGDDRFFNNVFIGRSEQPETPKKTADRRANATVTGFGLWVYDTREQSLLTGGNVYFGGARAYARETDATEMAGDRSAVALAEGADGVFLVNCPVPAAQAVTRRVTGEMLGRVITANLPFENRDGTAITLDVDYFGNRRNAAKPGAGPFGNAKEGSGRIKVW